MTSNEPEDTDAVDLAEEVKDMLVNAEAWVGGRPGVCTDRATAYAKENGLIGARGGLTREGMARAQQEQRAYFYGTS